MCCIPIKICCDHPLWGHVIVNFWGGCWSPCEICCSPPVRPAVYFVRYVVVILLEQIIVWIVLTLQPTSVGWVMVSSKVRYLERKERPGVDTIKYHTWPRTPYWKVTKAQWNITYREPRGQPFPNRWPQGRKKQTSQTEKTKKYIHKRSTALEWSGNEITGGLKLALCKATCAPLLVKHAHPWCWSMDVPHEPALSRWWIRSLSPWGWYRVVEILWGWL